MKKTSVTPNTGIAQDSQQTTSAPDVLGQIIADARLLDDDRTLSGWDLLAKDIAIEEADRACVLNKLSDFRDQAIRALAYWASLSQRVEGLHTTQQLLARMPAQPARGADIDAVTDAARAIAADVAYQAFMVKKYD